MDKKVKDEIIDENKIQLDPKKYIVSKTDKKGIIEYGNDYFTEISGYSNAELLGKPHSIIRHPDMPKIIFKLLWDRIEDGKSIYAVVKNLSKDGKYYWVITETEPNLDALTNKPESYIAYRKAASDKVIKEIEPLYQKLLEIEKVSGMDGSQKYLTGFLNEKGMNYDKYIAKVIGIAGIKKVFFNTMKRIFKKNKHKI
jgi:PAS domain S-box-containing protein